MSKRIPGIVLLQWRIPALFPSVKDPYRMFFPVEDPIHSFYLQIPITVFFYLWRITVIVFRFREPCNDSHRMIPSTDPHHLFVYRCRIYRSWSTPNTVFYQCRTQSTHCRTQSTALHQFRTQSIVSYQWRIPIAVSYLGRIPILFYLFYLLRIPITVFYLYRWSPLTVRRQ